MKSLETPRNSRSSQISFFQKKGRADHLLQTDNESGLFFASARSTDSFGFSNNAQVLEKEADETSETVLHLLEKASVSSSSDAKPSGVDQASSHLFPTRHTQSPPIESLQNKEDQKEVQPEVEPVLRTSSMPDPPDDESPQYSKLEARLSARRSFGVPLPEDAREQMESAFHADFQGVQVHHDQEAAEISNELNARAFTFGQDIYFDTGEFQPDTTEGRRLLAHELTHTLQQASSIDDIQREPKGLAEVVGPLSENPTLAKLIQQHRETYPDDAALKKTAEAINLIFTDPINPLDLKKANIEFLASKSKNPHELDLFFDVFKLQGWLTEATGLSEKLKYVPEKTAFYNNSFYDVVLKGDLAWLPKHAVLKAYFPFRFIHTFDAYLYGPFRPKQSVIEIDKLEKLHEELNIWAKSPKGLKENERTLFALEAFIRFDKFRMWMLREVEKVFEKKKVPLPDQKEVIASFLRNFDWGFYADRFDLAQESRFLLQQVESKAKQHAGVARETLQKSREAIGKLAKEGFPDFSKSSEYLAFAPYLSRSEIKQVEKDLLPVARSIFKLSGSGKLPTSDTYQKRLKSATKKVKESTNRISIALIQLMGKQEKDRPQSLDLLYGIIQRFLVAIYSHLESFGQGEFAIDQHASGVQDPAKNAQILHRIKAANQFFNLSNMLGIKELKAVAWEVKAPTGKSVFGTAQSETFLAFENDLFWKQDEVGGVGILDKFNEETGKVDGSQYLAYLMKIFFRQQLYKQQIALLEKNLTEYGGRYDYKNDSESYQPIINRVNEQSDAINKSQTSVIPRRYILKGAHFSVIPSDWNSFGPMVQNHALFTKAFGDQFASSDINIVPFDASSHYNEGGIVVWVMSNLDVFVATLKTLFPNLVPATANVSELQWLHVFAKRLKEEEDKLDKDNTKAGSQIFLDELVKKTESELFTDKSKTPHQDIRVAKENLWRKAYSHHRRVMIKNHIWPLWDAFDDKVGTWSNPKDALRKMLDIGVYATPKTDKKLQLAATFLELGPLIHKRLLRQEVLFGLLHSKTDRIDVIQRLLPHAVGVQTLADEVFQQREHLDLSYAATEHPDRLKMLVNLQQGLTGIIKSAYSGEYLKGKAGDKEWRLEESDSRIPFTHSLSIPYEGKMYRLTKVYRDFKYQPAVNLIADFPMDFDWPADMIRDINPSSFWLVENGKEKYVNWRDRAGIKLFDLEIVGMQGGDVEKLTITATNDKELAKIKAIISIHTSLENLRVLGETLETAAEWMTAPIYFIPGLGQAVLAGELVVGVLQFLTSPEFNLIKKVLGGEGIEVLKKAYDSVQQMFDADKLWEILLNDQVAFPDKVPGLPDTTTEQKRSVSSIKHTKGGAIKRMFGRFQRVGVKIYGGIKKLKNTFNFLVKRIRLFVLQHPLLARMFQFISNNFPLLAHYSSKAFEAFSDGSAKDETNAFSGQINEMLGNLETLEVPRTIVPMSAIVDLVITLALKIIAKGPKKIVIGVVKGALEEIGVYEKITQYVGNALKGSFIDPNKYWEEFITANLQPKVEKAGQDLAGSIREVIEKVPFLKGTTGPQMPKIEQLTEDEEWETLSETEPEAQMFVAPSREVHEETMLPDLSGSGNPLREDHLAELGGRFGHDFSHVRIHQGSETAAATEELGAEALTSGSHVYLKPGLSLDSSQGQDIFHHELGHVIQQTGPRSLDSHHTDQPLKGQSGVGLNMEPKLEEAADRFAADSGTSGTGFESAGGSVTPGSIQPKLEDITLGFFESVSAVPRAHITNASFYARLSQQEKQFAQGLPAKLKTAFGALQFPRTSKFKSIETEIKNFLKGKNLNVSDLQNIVNLSKVKKKQKDKEEWVINRDRLELGLEEYLAIESGVLLDIELNKDRQKSVNLQDPIKSLTVINVYLERMNTNASLWKLVIENTFEKGTKPPDTNYKVSEKDEYIKAAKKVLQVLEIQRVFAKDGFRFTDAFAKYIEQQVHPTIDGLHTGEENDPIPINWYKHPNDYPKKLSLRVNNNRETFFRDKPKTINHKGESVQVGADPSWWEKTKQRRESDALKGPLKRVTSKRDPSKAATYREALKDNHVWIDDNSRKAQLGNEDVDHITDLSFGGKDDFENFWPLTSFINRIPFQEKWLERYKIEYKDGNKRELSSLKEMYGKWFIVKSYNPLPEQPGGRWRKLKR